MERKKIAEALETAILSCKKEFVIDQAYPTVSFGGDDIRATISLAGEPKDEPVPVPESEVTRPSFTVVGEGAIALAELFSDCEADAELRLVGSKRIKEEFGEFIRSRIFAEEKTPVTEEDVKSILKALRAQIQAYDCTIAIPLLQLDGVELTVGNVLFRPSTPVLAKFENELAAIIDGGPHPANDKPSIKKVALETMHRLLSTGGCLATVRERGTPDTLVDLATTAIVRCCALLQVFLTYYFPDPDNRREVFPNPVAFYSGALLYVEGAINLSAKRRGTNFPISLGPKEVAFLEQRGFFKVAELFATEKQGDPTAEAVVTASWWIARATLSSLHSEALAFFVVATERLLFRSEQVTVERWTSRMLWLLGTDPGKRRQLYPQLGKLYKVRSNVVHQGATAVDDTDLSLAKTFAMNCYFQFIDRLLNGQTQADIISSLDDAHRGF